MKGQIDEKFQAQNHLKNYINIWVFSPNVAMFSKNSVAA
jgi:hypothetical protein